jgi:hypothetical protein
MKARKNPKGVYLLEWFRRLPWQTQVAIVRLLQSTILLAIALLAARFTGLAIALLVARFAGRR